MKKAKMMLMLTVFSVAIVYGQTEKEKAAHDKLTLHHNKALEHAKAISDGSAKTKEDQKKSAEELDKSLTASKNAAAELKAEQKGKHPEAHKAIESQHKEAASHIKLLKDELNKQQPDKTKVKEHADKTHAAISKAEEEHKKTKSN